MNPKMSYEPSEREWNSGNSKQLYYRRDVQGRLTRPEGVAGVDEGVSAAHHSQGGEAHCRSLVGRGSAPQITHRARESAADHLWGAGGRPDPAGGADEGDVVGRGPGRGGGRQTRQEGPFGGPTGGARAGGPSGGLRWPQVGPMWVGPSCRAPVGVLMSSGTRRRCRRWRRGRLGSGGRDVGPMMGPDGGPDDGPGEGPLGARYGAR